LSFLVASTNYARWFAAAGSGDAYSVLFFARVLRVARSKLDQLMTGHPAVAKGGKLALEFIEPAIVPASVSR